MQLRDDIPGILNPGCWGLFGGHIEAGETPEVALKRELKEEISYDCHEANYFRCYSDEQVIRHVFWTSLAVPSEELILQEGWDLDLLTVEEIEKGEHYSKKAQQVRLIGKPHQRILLDFHGQGLDNPESGIKIV